MFSYFFGSGKEKKVENENPELALRDMLDEHGDFKVNMDGTLTFDDYCTFRCAIMRQAVRMFLPRKEAFNAKKLEIYKTRN